MDATLFFKCWCCVYFSTLCTSVCCVYFGVVYLGPVCTSVLCILVLCVLQGSVFWCCACACQHAPGSTDALLVIWQFFNRLYLTDMATPPIQNWKEDFQAMREREPPDCWDMEFTDGVASPKAAVHKPWRRAATFIPKVPVTTKKQSAGCKQVRSPSFHWT